MNTIGAELGGAFTLDPRGPDNEDNLREVFRGHLGRVLHTGELDRAALYLVERYRTFWTTTMKPASITLTPTDVRFTVPNEGADVCGHLAGAPSLRHRVSSVGLINTIRSGEFTTFVFGPSTTKSRVSKPRPLTREEIFKKDCRKYLEQMGVPKDSIEASASYLWALMKITDPKPFTVDAEVLTTDPPRCFGIGVFELPDIFESQMRTVPMPCDCGISYLGMERVTTDRGELFLFKFNPVDSTHKQKFIENHTPYLEGMGVPRALVETSTLYLWEVITIAHSPPFTKDAEIWKGSPPKYFDIAVSEYPDLFRKRMESITMPRHCGISYYGMEEVDLDTDLHVFRFGVVDLASKDQFKQTYRPFLKKMGVRDDAMKASLSYLWHIMAITHAPPFTIDPQVEETTSGKQFIISVPQYADLFENRIGGVRMSRDCKISYQGRDTIPSDNGPLTVFKFGLDPGVEECLREVALALIKHLIPPPLQERVRAIDKSHVGIRFLGSPNVEECTKVLKQVLDCYDCDLRFTHAERFEEDGKSFTQFVFESRETDFC